MILLFLNIVIVIMIIIVFTVTIELLILFIYPLNDGLMNYFTKKYVDIRNSYYKSIIHYLIYSTFIRKPLYKKNQEVVYIKPNYFKSNVEVLIVEDIIIDGKDYYYTFKRHINCIHEDHISLSTYQNRINILNDILD